LPTEAQWEYACRAGTTTVFNFGNQLNGKEANCNNIISFGTSVKGPFLERTEKVGSYPANRWGLHDMHGNVWQYCADYYEPDYYKSGSSTDPFCRLKPAEERRVQRGGAWSEFPYNCRAATRVGIRPADHSELNGFRVCLRLD